MADGKTIEQKVYEVLLADPTFEPLLVDDESGDRSLYLGTTNPVGIRMPAVNIEWRCFKSEEKIHAERGVLNLYLSQTKEGTEHYGTYIAFRDAILAIFNRNEGQPLTEIDVPSNEGLRVVMILKQKCIFEFNEEQDKYESLFQFEIVKGEDENFDYKDFGQWTCE